MFDFCSFCRLESAVATVVVVFVIIFIGIKNNNNNLANVNVKINIHLLVAEMRTRHVYRAKSSASLVLGATA